MATSQSTIDFLLDQLSDIHQVTAKKMFGEYCLYLSGKPVALVCDDQLFLKSTSVGLEFIPTVIEASPYPKAKLHFLITADLWEDRDWLNQLLKATANALPQPKPKKKMVKEG